MELSMEWIFLLFFTALVAAQESFPTDQPDPCLDKTCKNPPGSMCVPQMKGDKLKAKCKCPTDCTEEAPTPACSVYGKEYTNLCEMHLYACKKGKNIKLAYNGPCVASQLECTKDELIQFPHRILDWFLHLKEINEFGRLNPDNNIRKITDEEREKLARWKFDQLDRKRDDQLDSRDLKEFRYALMPLEHCADDFFRMCDEDNNGKVSYEEWVDCLMVYDRPEEGIITSQAAAIATAQVNVVDPANNNDVQEREPQGLFVQSRSRTLGEEDDDDDEDDDENVVVDEDEDEEQATETVNN